MARAETTLRPPSKWLLMIEGRAIYELLSAYATFPFLRKGPQGDGHPVLVLPGFLASDTSTGTLRCYLKQMGYIPHRWKMGRNLGPRNRLEERLIERVETLNQRFGKKVSLVGWSLGGVYARMIANRAPELVRSVITLGSPFNHSPKATNSWRLFNILSERPVDEIDPETFDQVRRTPPVPTTAVYTRSDAVANWRCCIDDSEGPLNENIEVLGSHCGLGVNPLALHVIGDRLAQKEGNWRPFDRSGIRRMFYSQGEDNVEATPTPA